MGKWDYRMSQISQNTLCLSRKEVFCFPITSAFRVSIRKKQTVAEHVLSCVVSGTCTFVLHDSSGSLPSYLWSRSVVMSCKLYARGGSLDMSGPDCYISPLICSDASASWCIESQQQHFYKSFPSQVSSSGAGPWAAAGWPWGCSADLLIIQIFP